MAESPLWSRAEMKALATSALILVSLSNTDYSQKTSKHIRRVGLKASVQTAPRSGMSSFSVIGL